MTASFRQTHKKIKIKKIINADREQFFFKKCDQTFKKFLQRIPK